jgi:hypothetical protein
MVTNSNTNTENSQSSKCPFCGSENLTGSVFCQECGRKFNESYPPPPPPNPKRKQSSGRSHGSRTIVIAAVAGILIACLASAAIVYMAPSLLTGDNGSQATLTPTPNHTIAPIPTIEPTTPVYTPTPSPTLQQENNTITAVNVKFIYQTNDQEMFGAASQTSSFSNQPNGILSIYQGQQFWYSFKLTAGSIVSSDSITSIVVTTPGFSIVSITPDTPIEFTAGSSTTISVTLSTPDYTFNGPVTLVITTSG